ncbi:MAG: cytochrome-c peroxidase [Flavobacteriales bacterium]
MPKILLFCFSILVVACTDCPTDTFSTTTLNITKPAHFPAFPNIEENQLTIEGVALGKALFYEKKLSGDNTMSCNTCHQQEQAFATTNAVEIGIDGLAGTRSSMPLFNLLWNKEHFFWDGRAQTLGEQTQLPVEDPIEMHETWENAIEELKQDPDYVTLFKKAYNSSADDISAFYAGDALRQFLKSMVSSNSKYDKFRRGELNLTPEELAGYQVFIGEGPVDGISTGGADCFHCHGEPLFTDYLFHNNALDTDADQTDVGRLDATGFSSDKAKFKTPSLRNIAFTAPYMHDGRFETLEEVVEHYNVGGKHSATVDPLMKYVGEGLLLTDDQKQNLLAFLYTLSDDDFITNSDYK